MAGSRRRLTEPQLLEMAELREQGWTYQRISTHFAKLGITISPNALSWQCLRVGADAPPEFRRPCLQFTRPYFRGSFTVRPYSEAEDAQLLEMEAEGKSYSEMARALDRRPNSIRGRFMVLARREARAEEASTLSPAGD